MINALRPHFISFLTLLLFLALSAGGAFVPLGGANLPFALAISGIKTAIVAIFFMELRKADTLIRLVAFVGLIWLTIFLMLALSDTLTRFSGRLLG